MPGLPSFVLNGQDGSPIFMESESSTDGESLNRNARITVLFARATILPSGKGRISKHISQEIFSFWAYHYHWLFSQWILFLKRPECFKYFHRPKGIGYRILLAFYPRKMLNLLTTCHFFRDKRLESNGVF